jgi:hypothetical protein
MTLAVNIAQSGSNNVTFRNRLINGAMVISQRNGTSSVSETGTAQYTLDRWQVAGASPGVFSIAQSTTAPTGYINSLLITVTTADASLSGASYQLQQKVEGLNITDLDWGLSTAKPVTLSFWVRSSLTGNFGGVLTNNNYDWTYPYSYTISSANTWTQISVTIAGPTSGTWLTTNGMGIQLVFGLGAQVARTATAGVWANTVARQPTSSVNLIATNGATLYITGVQLEAGTTASPFEYRQYGTELQLCQRYYENNYSTGYAVGSAASYPYNVGQFVNGYTSSSGQKFQTANFLVPKRTNQPTNTYYDAAGNSGKISTLDSGGTDTNNVSPGVTFVSDKYLGAGPSTGTMTGSRYFWTCSAEL